MLHILRLECFYRETHKIEMNMGMAKFPSQASIESFDFSCSQLDKSEILSLAKCDWIASHENVLFYGQPGLGKTHLAIALGKKAIVDKAYSVKFISANDLMAELEQARQQKAVDDYLRLINRADLIIVDEFGYPLMENHPSYAALQGELKHHLTQEDENLNRPRWTPQRAPSGRLLLLSAFQQRGRAVAWPLLTETPKLSLQRS